MAEHINGPLYWERMGRTGTPMVFVHPNPLDQSCWMYQMTHLSTWFQCVGVDIPGYGRSPTGEVGMTMADMADACWEALDEAVGKEPAILVGCSTGSRIAPWMFHRQPDRTLAIIVSGTGYSATSDVAERRIKQYTDGGIEFRYDYVFDVLSKEFGATDMAKYFANLFTERNEWADLETIIEQFRALSVPYPDDFHAKITAPMLILTGSEDNAHQRAFALQERVPGCELYTLDGAGHACQLEKPWEWDREALRFLAKKELFAGKALSLEPVAAA
jgi:pimeloyl-ACP methyl ester carboxylesterase